MTFWDLEDIASRIPPKLPNGTATNSPFWRGYCVACGVIIGYLGQDWWQTHIAQPPPDASYFPAVPEGFPSCDESSNLLTCRAVGFAETLYNLQGIRGFAGLVDYIRTSPPRDVHARVAELSVAGYLLKCGLEITARPQTGIRGSDFDFEVSGSPSIAVEVKSKLDRTSLGEASLRQAINDAHKQLPREMPGLVVVNFRDENVGRGTGIDVARVACEEMRQKRRIAGFVWMAEVHPLWRGHRYLMQAVQVVRNPTCRLPVDLSVLDAPHGTAGADGLARMRPGVNWISLFSASNFWRY